ncbi:MAG: family 43 glycosylhydrolase [Eubacteriales bacterium]|nr:family 43 glycosylhydrolase [Eubacteriales bacterium]
MKRFLSLILCVAAIASVSGCGIVRKYVPEKSSHFGSWAPDGITEDMFEKISALNKSDPGTYSEGSVRFNAAQRYAFPMSAFSFDKNVSGFSHIAFEITNENGFALEKVALTLSTKFTNKSATGYTHLEPGQSGIVIFPVSKFEPINLSKFIKFFLTCSDHGGECYLSVKDIWPVNVDAGQVKTACEIRDPFILEDNGVYYMYGTGWKYYKNTSGDLNGEWTGPYPCIDWNNISENIPDYEKDCWAPEVYKYNGSYYMITTYNSSERGSSDGEHKYDGRGTVILRAEDPEGPFTKWSDGQITPDTWDCIDGTLYIDDEGQPWLYFVHEWTSTDGEGGKFSCAKLSSDLKTLISEPKDVFNAGGVTDGCFIYTAANGDLLSLWSTYDDDYGYCVNVIRSKNGIDGDWLFDSMLYSSYYGAESGGHGMLFTDSDGRMKMSFHIDSDKNYAAFINVKEENNRLVISDMSVSDITE